MSEYDSPRMLVGDVSKNGAKVQSTEENQDAQAMLEELREAVLSDWMVVVDHVTRTQRAMEATVSWRVTKPLRMARTLQQKSAELGVLTTSRLAAATLADRLRRP